MLESLLLSKKLEWSWSRRQQGASVTIIIGILDSSLLSRILVCNFMKVDASEKPWIFQCFFMSSWCEQHCPTPTQKQLYNRPKRLKQSFTGGQKHTSEETQENRQTINCSVEARFCKLEGICNLENLLLLYANSGIYQNWSFNGSHLSQARFPYTDCKWSASLETLYLNSIHLEHINILQPNTSRYCSSLKVDVDLLPIIHFAHMLLGFCQGHL